jgi:hypothetical protein
LLNKWAGAKKLVNQKIDEDYKKSNLAIQKAAENEILNVRKEVSLLKEKAAKVGEAMETTVK